MNAATESTAPRLEVDRTDRFVGFAKIEAVRDKQKAMRAALYAVIAPLPTGAPSPRHFWYDLTKEERGRIIALDDDVTMCRAALRDAHRHEEECPGVVAQVRAAIVAYYAAKADAVFAGETNDDALPLPHKLPDIAKELSDVTVAAARVAVDPSPANQHALRHEAAEGRDVIDTLIRTAVGHHRRAS